MKKRSHLNYLTIACIIVAIIFLIDALFFNSQPSPQIQKTIKPEQITTPAVIEKPFMIQRNKVAPAVVLEDSLDMQPDENADIVDEEPADIEPAAPYKVKVQYPTQHVFDDSLCNLNERQENFKPQLEKAVKRLGSSYTHEYFKLNDYLELNLYSINASSYFKEKLAERILQLHKSYIRMLGRLAEKEMTINLIILAKRSHYLHHIAYFSDEISNSLGVYFGGLNLAFVDYQASDDKALKTAMHESVHVLNAHIIGRTPHMFNEGMAEFYENINVKEGKTQFNESEHQLTRQAYPVSLFFDNEQWRYLNTGQLYYSSWLWTTFMHTNNEGIGALIYFMQKEQEDPCSNLSADESYSLFQEAYNVFETDFNDIQEELPAYQE